MYAMVICHTDHSAWTYGTLRPADISVEKAAEINVLDKWSVHVNKMENMDAYVSCNSKNFKAAEG